MATSFLNNARSTFSDYEISDTQISALKNHLEGNITAEEAAKQLTAHPEAASTPLELQQRLGGLWTLLNDTAVAVPSKQPEIISILQAIRTLPKGPVPKGEGEDVMELDEGYYWRELTDWANNWADTFNSHAAHFSIDLKSTDDKEKREKAKEDYISACAYTARLAATNDYAISSYGAAIERATPAISEALEVDTTHDKELESLEAAAQLFLYAAPELHRRCKEGRKEGMLESSAAEAWKGKKGFSMERWRFWGQKWDELAKKEGLSDDAKGLAKKARETMERIGDV